MPTKYERPGMQAVFIYVPVPLHRQAIAHVNHVKRTEDAAYSLQRLMVEALKEYVEKRS